ncbi:MAG: hypothetical protein GC185_05370 [Alphaproteobacteria bacterium]|nr:hypothetical protein [Alphaproteobacteria bacterium]
MKNKTGAKDNSKSNSKANPKANPKANGSVVYKLAGRSLEAALRLEEELKRELQTVPVMQSGNLKDIGDSWDAMYKGLLARLEKEAPEVLELTGLKSSSVQVFQGPQTLPRAYAESPQIFSSPERAPEYFMYAPVDYKGEHFVPEDGVKLSAKEERTTDNRLFAGGWLGNAPIVTVKKRGVETPADYKPPSKSALRKAFSYMPNDRVCFLAAGRSLEIVEDLKARKEDWQEKLGAACRAIEAEVLKTKPWILAELPPGEDVRVSATYSYMGGGGGKAELLLSVRREGKDDIWNAGKTVTPPPSPAFDTGERGGGDCTVLPRRDTEEGRALAALIDAIPETPGLRDYPELYADFSIEKDEIGQMLGVNGTVPQSVDVAGRTVLLYNAAPESGKNGFCPPGATPFPAEAYEWLRSDEGDRNMGITPPPMPKSLAALLDGKTPSKKQQKENFRP